MTKNLTNFTLQTRKNTGKVSIRLEKTKHGRPILYHIYERF